MAYMGSGFDLGAPALVCRWRLAGGRLPLENRHLRALAARQVNGAPVTTELVAWAKQHIEWNLQAGAVMAPDGVLMLVVDERGQAAMSVGSFEPLADTTLEALARRARGSRREARETGVAPETLWCVRDGVLRWWPGEGCAPSGAASLVVQLAETLGLEVSHDREALVGLGGVHAGKAEASHLPDADLRSEEAFLVSDEHGVVPAADVAGPVGMRLQGDWQVLLERTRH